jgi:glutamine phosphoribosylpyrophosphate amidotransferase
LGCTLGADSLAFISVEGLLESLSVLDAIQGKNDGPASLKEVTSTRLRSSPLERSYCLEYFTGEYPIPVSGETKE